ncbi:eukaryotic initiation factor 4b-related [Anaeramoeba ignava]|uniref:Eukaryotic initiation factor 4b-related n=1 Tax=Anaeramoeba ignava TaxID=1746090 RepID=A0A9Q0LMX9_ANAIG|nr:eukaryotic initiation factor 4b-related [Anaeramoeba ignava]
MENKNKKEKENNKENNKEDFSLEELEDFENIDEEIEEEYDDDIKKEKESVKQIEKEEKRLERELQSPSNYPLNRDSRSVFVGNIAGSVSEEDLTEFFKSCGEIKTVKLFKNELSIPAINHAYIEFEDIYSVEKALKLNGNQLQGLELTVTEKRTNYPKTMRGRGRGRSRGRGRGRGYGRGYGRVWSRGRGRTRSRGFSYPSRSFHPSYRGGFHPYF